MSKFWGVAFYEYRMAIRRWGLWVAFLAAGALYFVPTLTEPIQQPEMPMWAFAGSLAFSLNMLMPVIGGIAMADRLPRDARLGTRELLASTPLHRRSYVLGKYVGTVAATVTPVLASVVLLAIIITVRGLLAGVAPTDLAAMDGALLVAFLVINLPAYIFVGAFSLACPALLPVRVYQVLFTGYWFWGNFLNPRFIPSLADTVLAPCGKYAAGAFFNAGTAGTGVMVARYTTTEAVLNIVVLFACATAALIALERYLAWQGRRA